jgi:translation initiation factor eIF-2B subunit alpha/methylthioribose-1-phosphate isomerase|tara:strand:- start:120 stop:1148 length:1029 start_codon:yes stop_codon:yes gene_type:complete
MKVKVDGEEKEVKTVWFEQPDVVMIDQPKLPFEFALKRFSNYKATADAITTMVVRGAPAIGATAGYATAQAVLQGEDMQTAADYIKKARPTAIDLAHGVDRILNVLGDDAEANKKIAVEEAEKLAQEYIEKCSKIGDNGNELIKDGDKILTHCNAGWLACVEWGTATAPIYKAKRAGKTVFVWVDETRPRCQGARLTAWEMAQEGVEHAVIADNSAGYYMKKGEVNLCITGADRVARNGDTANKIGTYEKAVVAKANNIPFYIAIPANTYDFDCENGDAIPIEERDEGEVTHMWGEGGKIRIANPNSKARNPAFDVTPAEYITGYITEKGVLKAEELSQLTQ